MSNTCTIEGLKAGDRPFLLESILDVLQETYPEFKGVGRIEQRERAEALIARYAQTPGSASVLCLDGERAGMIWWLEEWHPVTEERLGLILLVRVAPEYRRRGLGRMLLEHAHKEAKAEGIEHLRLFANPDNHPAFELYRSLGFRPKIAELHWQ